MPGGNNAEGTRKIWTTLSQIVVLLTGAIMAFVWQPPRLTPVDDGTTYAHAARFVGVIVVVLVLIFVRRGDWRARTLMVLTAGTGILSLLCFFTYRLLIGLWTCGYDGRGPVVIGRSMLPEAQRYAVQNAVRNCQAMIQDAAGDTAAIWNYQDLLIRHLSLAALFMATVLLFTIAGLLAVETYRLHGSPAAKRGRVVR